MAESAVDLQSLLDEITFYTQWKPEVDNTEEIFSYIHGIRKRYSFFQYAMYTV